MTTTHRWGMVLNRPRTLYTSESFFVDVIDGIEEMLRGTGLIFFLHQTLTRDEEAQTYERWAADHFVDGVVVVDLADNDPRPAHLEQLGLYALYAGAEEPPSGACALTSNNASWTYNILTTLYELGHRRIARVIGPSHLTHIRARIKGAQRFSAETGCEVIHLEGDYSASFGHDATTTLLNADTPPSVIVYDNEAMALEGLRVVHNRHMAVPTDISMVAWDDSLACQLSHPSLTALSYNPHELGCLVGQAIINMARGCRNFQMPYPPRHWILRESVSTPCDNPRAGDALTE